MFKLCPGATTMAPVNTDCTSAQVYSLQRLVVTGRFIKQKPDFDQKHEGEEYRCGVTSLKYFNFPKDTLKTAIDN